MGKTAKKGDKPRAKVIVYTREHGPICYELDILGRPALVEELLASGLQWFWESASRHLDSSTDPKGELPLTEITADTAAAFLEDVQQRDEDGYSRWIALYGLTARGTLQDHPLKPALWEFATREHGLLGIVAVQVSDAPQEYVFVPHEPAQSVRALLEIWGVPPNLSPEAFHIRPYKRLRMVQLELMYGLQKGPTP